MSFARKVRRYRARLAREAHMRTVRRRKGRAVVRRRIEKQATRRG